MPNRYYFGLAQKNVNYLIPNVLNWKALVKLKAGLLSLAAQRARLERQSLYRLLKKHGIDPRQFNPRESHFG